MNKPGRIKCLKDFIADNHLDFIGIQESKKETFPCSFLDSVNKNMVWNFVPADGTKGGILVGVKAQVIEVVSWQIHSFCAELILKNVKEELIWRLVVVYGPAYDELKLSFITELHSIMGNWLGPTLIGGDFNLVRSEKDKNNEIINFQHATTFNYFINH
jgi:exonuclease III